MTRNRRRTLNMTSLGARLWRRIRDMMLTGIYSEIIHRTQPVCLHMEDKVQLRRNRDQPFKIGWTRAQGVIASKTTLLDSNREDFHILTCEWTETCKTNLPITIFLLAKIQTLEASMGHISARTRPKVITYKKCAYRDNKGKSNRPWSLPSTPLLQNCQGMILWLRKRSKTRSSLLSKRSMVSGSRQKI